MNAFFSSSCYPRELGMSEGGDNGTYVHSKNKIDGKLREMKRDTEREREELKDAIAPISWIFVEHKRFSLFLSLSLALLIWENSFYLCLKRRICLCYYSSTKLNFRSLSPSICPTIAVTRMHDILSHSVMSYTVAPTAYTHLCVCVYWSIRRCLYQKVWIDIIYHTSFSIVFGR